MVGSDSVVLKREEYKYSESLNNSSVIMSVLAVLYSVHMLCTVQGVGVVQKVLEGVRLNT